MPRIPAIAAAALLSALGGAMAHAGDFAPRTTGSFAAVGDDPGARASCPDASSAAAMSDADASATRDSAAAGSVHTGPSRSAKHIGVDDVVSEAHTAAADDDKAAGAAAPSPHRSRAAARWQSLLPGVMK